MTYACTYVDILTLLEARLHSHLVCKSTILAIDNVEDCVGYAWLHLAAHGGTVVPKDDTC